VGPNAVLDRVDRVGVRADVREDLGGLARAPLGVVVDFSPVLAAAADIVEPHRGEQHRLVDVVLGGERFGQPGDPPDVMPVVGGRDAFEVGPSALADFV